MKNHNYKVLAVLLITLTSTRVESQNFNNTYGFNSSYQNSDNACVVELTNGNVVAGGTVSDPSEMNAPTLAGNGMKTVVLSTIDPLSGLVLSTPVYYGVNGKNHYAVDIIESVDSANWVIVASNINDPVTEINEIGLMMVNPVSGAVLWTKRLTANNQPSKGQAVVDIESDGTGGFYVLGTVVNQYGWRDAYLANVSETGVVLWEYSYTIGGMDGGDMDELEAQRLLFDGTYVLFTANYNRPIASDGLIVQLVSATGGPGRSSWVYVLGTGIMDVHDANVVDGKYIVAGEVHLGSSSEGFLLKYNPGFQPTIPTVQVFRTNTTQSLVLKGVTAMGDGSKNMLVAFDHTDSLNVIHPGITQLDSLMMPLLSHEYEVQGYLGTKGIIRTGNGTDVLLKGASDSTAITSVHSMNLIGTSTPMVSDPNYCSSDYPYFNVAGITTDPPQLFRHNETSIKNDMDIFMGFIGGEIYDCNENFIDDFNDEPSGIKVNLQDYISIYPNPVQNQLKIKTKEGIVVLNVRIYNNTGQLIDEENSNEVDSGTWKNGIYFLEINTSEGMLRAKVVK